MATRVPTITSAPTGLQNGVLVSWAGLLNGDDGTPWTPARFRDMTWQITGTLGAGGSVTLEGSNDGTNYAALSNQAGTAATKTAAGISQVAEMPRFVRPRVTAGDGTTTLVATLWATRTR